MVGDGVSVQAEFTMSPITKCVEVTRGGEGQAVVLSTGDVDDGDMLETGHGVRSGGLQDPVPQPQLSMTALTPTINVTRDCESQCVITTTSYLKY